MDLEKAVAFVTDRGNEIEQARINYVLANERPSELIVGKLFAGQRPDGSWSPFWANDYSSLDATCFRLAQAEQLGLTKEEPAIIRAIRFLAQRQTPDGSWEEDEQIADLAPPWTVPGTVETRLYLTANCGTSPQNVFSSTWVPTSTILRQAICHGSSPPCMRPGLRRTIP